MLAGIFSLVSNRRVASDAIASAKCMDCRCSRYSIATRAACLSQRRSVQRQQRQAPATCFSQNTGPIAHHARSQYVVAVTMTWRLILPPPPPPPPPPVTSCVDLPLTSHCYLSRTPTRLDAWNSPRPAPRMVTQLVLTFADSPAGGGSGQEAMRVSFAMPYRCEFGQHIALVGSDEYLGDWDVQRGVPMNWQDGDVWTVDVELPPTCALRPSPSLPCLWCHLPMVAGT